LKNKEVIKHSAAIQTSHNKISLLQKKAWNILLANSYDNLLQKEVFEVKIKDLVDVLCFESKNEKHLKESLKALLATVVEWNVLDKDHEHEWGATTMLSSVKIKKGMLEYSFSPYLKEKLYNPTMYAKISLTIQSKFKSKYALILYELCVDYFIRKQGKGETPWISTDDFIKLVGIEKEKSLQEFKIMKRTIINKAINEINEKSDIFVTVDLKKESRKVVALKFNISPTPHSNNILTRLIKPPKQGELSFKTDEEEKKELYERMTNAFTLSDRQAKELLNTMHDYDEIKDILDMVERKIKRDEVMNIGAYTYKALKDHYQPRKSIIAIEREQESEKRQLEEKKKAKEKEIIDRLIEEYERYKVQTVKEYISGLSKKNQEGIKKQFEESLDNFLKGIYRESGLESPMISPYFIEFMSTNYMEILNFPSFAQERGFLLEQDKEGWKMVNIKEMLL
jgi:plasmid replication initiation protein